MILGLLLIVIVIIILTERKIVFTAIVITAATARQRRVAVSPEAAQLRAVSRHHLQLWEVSTSGAYNVGT